MTRIETTRLSIKNFDSVDWKALQEIVASYRSSEYAIYDREWPTSEETIQEITASFARGDDFLAVWLKEADKLIGFIALNRTSAKDLTEFDIGCVLNSAYHNHGYASEGCKAVLSHAFRTLKADRVVSGTAAVNGPSVRLLRNIGMSKTGESVCSFQKDEKGNPIPFVGCTFAVTRQEWHGRLPADGH